MKTRLPRLDLVRFVSESLSLQWVEMEESADTDFDRVVQADKCHAPVKIGVPVHMSCGMTDQLEWSFRPRFVCDHFLLPLSRRLQRPSVRRLSPATGLQPGRRRIRAGPQELAARHGSL